MNIKTLTFLPGQDLPNVLITPQQSHSANIIEVITGEENLINCDGLWSANSHFLLGVKTADCAPICMWNGEKFGIVHAGWRGTVNGSVEGLLEVFKDSTNLNIWVGPILPKFEIKKDDCYDQIHHKFGEQFFTVLDDKIEFEFKKCLQHLLPPQTIFDGRSTFDDPSLSSWRRDKHFNNGQNVTVIGSSNLF